MENFTRITVQKAREIMTSGKVTVVDIRDAGSFAQGHIAQAQNVNDGNIKDFLGASDKEIPLVCYCYHGISSQQAAGYFAAQGFRQVYSIDGGWGGGRRIMVKFLFIFTFMFLMLSSISFAGYDDTKLKQEYGQDLTKAPFFLRYEYNKETGKDWGQTVFSEREDFLKNYEANMAKEQVKERDDAKAAAQEERDRLYEQRAEARKERDDEREQAEEEKAENEEDEQRQKDFDQNLRDQQQELQQLRQEAEEKQ